MHVAVAPACNIQCHYCNRKYDCANESRPGVVSEVLSPEQALKKVLVVAAAIPQLSVVGIAGPGDALANPARSFATLRLIAQHMPELKLCLSTNGLMLPQYADEIAALGVDHVTITINCLDPEIGAQIYPWVFWRHRRWRGRDAAAILIEQQLLGLDRLVAHGVLVKINSVMIPGINDAHLPQVSREVKARGAFLHNIMPLIAAPEHGTYFGLVGQRGPTAEELHALQEQCEGEMQLMRHCRQCRADAVGLLGEDRSEEFTWERIEALAADEAFLAAGRERRAQWRAQVAAQRLTHQAAQQAVLAWHFRDRFDEKAAVENAPGRPVRIAVAAKNGLVAEHFGHAREFLVYEVDGASARLIGVRKTDPYCLGPSSCGEEESMLSQTIAALAGCEVLLASKIGPEPWQALVAAGIQPNDEHSYEPVEAACLAVWHELFVPLRMQPQRYFQRVA